jgi:hypothetical protein
MAETAFGWECCEEDSCAVSNVSLGGMGDYGTMHATASGFSDGECEDCETVSISEELDTLLASYTRHSSTFHCLVTVDRQSHFINGISGGIYKKVCELAGTTYKLAVGVQNYRGPYVVQSMAIFESDWFATDPGETVFEAIMPGGSAYGITLNNVTASSALVCDGSTATATLTATPP